MKIQDLKTIPATTQAVHRLLSKMVDDLSLDNPGAGSAYVEYLLSNLGEKSLSSDGPLTMYDLIEVHGSLMVGLQLGSEADGIEDAFDLFNSKEDDNALSSYGMTLRFAVDKGLRPGMSFLNGRPLPSDEEHANEVNQIFAEEQQYVFGMIMNGKITDKAPKSVYAEILTGPRVFKRNHPLLVQGSGSTGSSMYASLSRSKKSSNSFIRSSVVPTFADANFVIDAYIDFSTKEGLTFISKLITVLEMFPTTIEDTTTDSDSDEYHPSSSASRCNSLIVLICISATVRIPSRNNLKKTALFGN